MLWYVSWNYAIFHASGVNCYIKRYIWKTKAWIFSLALKFDWRGHFFGRNYVSVKKPKIQPSSRSAFVESAQDTTFMSFLSTTMSDVIGHSAWKWQWVMGLTLAATPCPVTSMWKPRQKKKPNQQEVKKRAKKILKTNTQNKRWPLL